MRTMTDDIIDTRDLVAELAELQAAGVGQDLDDIERRAAIKALFEEISSYAGDRPEDGIALIADSYFTRYCEDLVSDIGDLPSDLPYYLAGNIDWGGVADDLRVDYTSVDFEGVTYWYR